MFKTTIRGLRAHKLRLLTSALAIVIGVAFISGTLVLSATITKTFDDLFANVYGKTDAVVRSATVVKTDRGDQRPSIPEGVLDQVRAAPGVATAQGAAFGQAQFIDHDGKAIGDPAQGAPTIAVNYTGDAKLDPFQVAEGSPPAGPDQVVMDKATADKYDFPIGSQVGVIALDETGGAATYQMTVVGYAKFGSADSPLGATVALFDTPTAQRLTDNVGKFTAIGATARPGVSQQQLVDDISPLLPSGTEVVTGAQVVSENQDQLHQNLAFFSTFLLVFAIIAVFVGSFVIYNTFSIIVAQRSREMALLRAIGATRRQVLTSVLAEAAIMGAVFSVVGLVAGVGLASGLKALLSAFGIGIPATGTVIPPAAIVVGFLAGFGVTVVVAFAPARRASKVPPVAAMRDVAVEPTHSSKLRIGAGLAVLAAGIGLLCLGLFGSSGNALASVGGGAAITFLGVAALGPVIAAPVSRVIGYPLARLRGITGRLARENAMRNPKRTASTASALMIGVGLVGFFTIFFSSVTASIHHTIDTQFHGDLVVDAGGFGQSGSPGVPQEVATRIAAQPGVNAVVALQFGPAEVNGSGGMIAGTDGATLRAITDVGVQQGSLADLGTDGLAVSRRYADDHGLVLGSEVPATFTETGPTQLRVAAIYGTDTLVGSFFLGREGYAAHFTPQGDNVIFVVAEPGQVPQVKAAVEDLTAPYPTAKVQDVAELKAEQAAQINTVLTLVNALLVLAVLIALLGIANTLALSIFERTHEIGLMRAVGMTRAQVRATVRWESVIIALLGTALGLVIGLAFGWAVVQALSRRRHRRAGRAGGEAGDHRGHRRGRRRAGRPAARPASGTPRHPARHRRRLTDT